MMWAISAESLLRAFRRGWRLQVLQVPPSPDTGMDALQPLLVVAASDPSSAPGSQSAACALVQLSLKCTAGTANEQQLLDVMQVRFYICACIPIASTRRAAAVRWICNRVHMQSKLVDDDRCHLPCKVDIRCSPSEKRRLLRLDLKQLAGRQYSKHDLHTVVHHYILKARWPTGRFIMIRREA